MYKNLLSKKQLLAKSQSLKVIILFIVGLGIPFIIELIGSKYNIGPFFISSKVWGTSLLDVTLSIWSGQIGASLIIFTLLSLISDKINERILEIRIGSWLFKYNLYFLNLFECMILIGLFNVASFLALLRNNNFGVIVYFMYIGSLILFVCYLIILIFYKKSRIYYRIWLGINNKRNINFKGAKIIEKIKKRMKFKSNNNENALICDLNYYKEEIAILLEIYFKFDNSNEDEQILINAISKRLYLNEEKLEQVFKDIYTYNQKFNKLDNNFM